LNLNGVAGGIVGGVGIHTVTYGFLSNHFHVWHGGKENFWAGHFDHTRDVVEDFDISLHLTDITNDTSINLLSIERIKLTDNVYALDLDGNAGIAAKAIIATFGAESLGAYMSAALATVDGGTSLVSLCDLVVENSYIENLVGSTTNGSFVDHVYENVAGTAPSSADHDTYTALLDNGMYTNHHCWH
jgi:hypothetical protein